MLVGYPDSSAVGVDDEDVVGDVINGLGVLARHADMTGAVGDLCVGSQILTNYEMSLARLGLPGRRVIRETRPVWTDTPIGKRTAPIEAVVVPGPSLVALTRNVTSDLFSPFGLPQPLQITVDNKLDRRFFADQGRQAAHWAKQAGVRIVDSD